MPTGAFAPRGRPPRVVRHPSPRKGQVLAITNVTFPTVWNWMRAGKFPRARVAGGRSMWLSTEIEAWLARFRSADLKVTRRRRRLTKSPLAWS